MLLLVPAIAFSEGGDSDTADSTVLSTTDMVEAERTPEKVDLGTAENYAVLAGSTITNTGTTTIIGDIGLHPGTEITGYEDIVHTGELNVDNAAAEQAKIDLVTAYDDAAGRTPSDSVNHAELAGLTLAPGVYNATSSMGLAEVKVLPRWSGGATREA